MATHTPKTLSEKKDPTGPPEKAGRPTDPDPRAVEVRKRWDDATGAIRQELYDYYLNYHFIEGNQWVYWNKEQSRLDQAPRDPDKVRLTVNRMRANSRTIMGKVNQRDLTFEVLPSDMDDSHIRGAKLGESQLENIRIDHRWEQLRESAVWSAWKAGTSAICIEWDPNAGDPAASPEDTGGVQRRKGDTVETALNLSEFAVQPGTRDGETALWWVKSQLLPPAEVQNTYDLSWMPDADGAMATASFLLKMTDKQGVANVNPMTQVFTLYERPNRRCPKGRIVVVVNDQVVFHGDWPYPWTEHLNLALIRETPLETRWSGSTVVTDARPIQAAFNQSWSNIVEHMKRAGNARLAMPLSSVDQMDDLSDLPGEVIPYPDGSQPPNWISPAQMPQWWVEQPSMLAQELDDVMGVHAVSRGSAPTNVESGYGLSILAEHDSTPSDRLVKEVAQAFSRIATMALKLYEVEVTTKRKTLVAIPGNAPMSLEWSGKDFRGQTTAIIPQDAILPRSRAAMMEFAKQALEMGLIQGMDQFALVAELPSSRQMLAALNKDTARARRENAGFATNHQSEPFDWDDHELHIIEHNNYRKTIDYELLTQEIKGLIAEHVQAHVTMAAEKLGGQQAAGAIGGPGLAGAPTVAGPAGDPAMNPNPLPPEPAPAEGEAPASNPEADKAALKEQVFNELLAEMNKPAPTT